MPVVIKQNNSDALATRCTSCKVRPYSFCRCLKEKELKNFAEEMGKTDEKELKERALNLRLIKELTAQVGTFMPATLFTGYDLREGWKNQPAGRQIITVPQIVATNWMLSIGITLKFHNLLKQFLMH